MQYPSYPFQQQSGTSEFFFESIGPKGLIQKIAIFSLISEPNIYNLALGDLNPSTATIDDQSVSDNGDTAVILATIFQITHQFLGQNPAFTVYFEGNTPARNRLYRMAINQVWNELSTYFTVLGLCYDSWERFVPNRPYDSFLIQKRVALQKTAHP